MNSAEWNVPTAEDVKRFSSGCKISLQIMKDLAEKYEKHDYPNDMKTKCYIKCMLEKLGTFDDTNGVNVEHTRKVSKNPRARVERCVLNRMESENACSWAYRIFECLSN